MCTIRESHCAIWVVGKGTAYLGRLCEMGEFGGIANEFHIPVHLVPYNAPGARRPGNLRRRQLADAFYASLVKHIMEPLEKGRDKPGHVFAYGVQRALHTLRGLPEALVPRESYEGRLPKDILEKHKQVKETLAVRGGGAAPSKRARAVKEPPAAREGDAAPSKRDRGEPICPICTRPVPKPLQEKLKKDLADLDEKEKKWSDTMHTSPDYARRLILKAMLKEK